MRTPASVGTAAHTMSPTFAPTGRDGTDLSHSVAGVAEIAGDAAVAVAVATGSADALADAGALIDALAIGARAPPVASPPHALAPTKTAGPSDASARRASGLNPARRPSLRARASPPACRSALRLPSRIRRPDRCS